MTIQNQTLTELKEGQSARVVSLLATDSMRRRLQDLGLIEGTRVECLQKSPSGDPVAYLIRGAAIALRTEDSSDILVSVTA
jgi:ferrous iron transport protein A